MGDLAVRVSAGTLRDTQGLVIEHAWTPEGAVAHPVSNGAHALHLAVALCVLNDLYREAEVMHAVVRGAAVTADGGFDERWASTGITYTVELDPPDEALLARVDEVAEIPRAIRAGGEVVRG